jgi:hypothetical protein
MRLIGLKGVESIGASWSDTIGHLGTVSGTILLFKGSLAKFSLQTINTIWQTCCLGGIRSWSSRSAFEAIIALVDVRRSFGERGADLVVWKIRLSRVWKQRKHSSDTLRRSSLACRDHDAKINEVIVDLSTARLDDVDIFSTNRILDLKAAFSDGKFRENSIASWYAKCVADVFEKLRVGIAPEDDDITNHDGVSCMRRKSMVEKEGEIGRSVECGIFESGLQPRLAELKRGIGSRLESRGGRGERGQDSGRRRRRS